jgi:HK97 gp10 family phage protein
VTADFTVDVKGLDALKERLETLPSTVRAGAEAWVQEETEQTAKDMRDGAPVLSGELRDGIEAVTAGLHGSAVSTTRHSTFVEHGTSSTPAQPFAQPAAEALRSRAPGTLKAAIAAAIEDT